MARIARLVVPDVPHHITQRGNRRQKTFFRESDYWTYLDLMREWAPENKLSVLAYCLMPNHVHLIVTPRDEEGLGRGIGEIHRRYTRIINKRLGWTGYLWQGRFASYPMDAQHLYRATRYILRNPVEAGFVESASDWPFSSARSHLTGKSDGVVDPIPLSKRIEDWERYLATPPTTEESNEIELHARTGRPMGSSRFITKLEERFGRSLRPGKRGPRPKQADGEPAAKTRIVSTVMQTTKN